MFGWLRRTFRPPPTEQQLRMARILASYPLYAPPEFNPNSTPESIRAASAQYEEYFLGSRQARLEALRTFLGNFDVSLDTDDVGLMAVSTWLPQSAAFSSMILTIVPSGMQISVSRSLGQVRSTA